MHIVSYRATKEKHKRIKQAALDENTTVQALLDSLIDAYLKAKDN